MATTIIARASSERTSVVGMSLDVHPVERFLVYDASGSLPIAERWQRVSDTSEATAADQRGARPSAQLLSMPATAAGWWAFGLEALAGVLFIAAALIHSPSMQTALWGRLSVVNKVMTVVTPAALIAALAGGVIAISSLARKRERSILVWFAAAIFVLAAFVVVASLI